MRIVYLHQYFVTPEMSGGTRSYEFARRLVADGHEVHMITSDMTGGKPRSEIIDGINVSWIPVPYSNSMGIAKRLRSFLEFAVRSSSMAANSRSDVIFATSTPLTIAIPAIYAKWRQKKPLVLEVRDPWPEMLIGMKVLTNRTQIKIMELLRDFAYRNSDHIIALSAGMKTVIVDAGYDVSSISVIPNSSDNDKFSVGVRRGQDFRQSHEWLGDRKMVLYAGSLGLANNVGYLVRIAKEFLRLDSNVRFVIAGKGAEEAKIKREAEDAGVLDSNLFMFPSMPKSEMPELFSAADICTVLLQDVPELWTNSSNKFFDALASGRPVAVNNVGWQQELVESKDAGVSLHPTDISQAARKLLGVLGNDAWLSEAGQHARALAESLFDRDKLYREFEAVLATVAKKAEGKKK